jgi:hypothetical protein
MALPVTIPNEFASATASIPLSQLDTNFTTLANAVNGISDGSETLANVAVTVAQLQVRAHVTTLNTSGQVVFNDAGADVDFRVRVIQTLIVCMLVLTWGWTEPLFGFCGCGYSQPGHLDATFRWPASCHTMSTPNTGFLTAATRLHLLKWCTGMRD